MLLHQRLLFFTFIFYSSFVTSEFFFIVSLSFTKKEPYPFSNWYIYNLPTFPCLFCSFYAEWLPYSVLFLSYASCTIDRKFSTTTQQTSFLQNGIKWRTSIRTKSIFFIFSSNIFGLDIWLSLPRGIDEYLSIINERYHRLKLSIS